MSKSTNRPTKAKKQTGSIDFLSFCPTKEEQAEIEAISLASFGELLEKAREGDKEAISLLKNNPLPDSISEIQALERSFGNLNPKELPDDQELTALLFSDTLTIEESERLTMGLQGKGIILSLSFLNSRIRYSEADSTSYILARYRLLSALSFITGRKGFKGKEADWKALEILSSLEVPEWELVNSGILTILQAVKILKEEKPDSIPENLFSIPFVWTSEAKQREMEILKKNGIIIDLNNYGYIHSKEWKNYPLYKLAIKNIERCYESQGKGMRLIKTTLKDGTVKESYSFYDTSAIRLIASLSAMKDKEEREKERRFYKVKTKKAPANPELREKFRQDYIKKLSCKIAKKKDLKSPSDYWERESLILSEIVTDKNEIALLKGALFTSAQLLTLFWLTRLKQVDYIPSQKTLETIVQVSNVSEQLKRIKAKIFTSWKNYANVDDMKGMPTYDTLNSCLSLIDMGWDLTLKDTTIKTIEKEIASIIQDDMHII